MLEFDPSLAEAIGALILALIGGAAGFEGGRRGRSPDHHSTEQLAALTRAQAKTTTTLAEVVTKLDHIVSAELVRIEERAEQVERSQRRLAGDIDAVSDVLDIMVTHDEDLPEAARSMICAKLQRPRRHEVTGVIRS